MFQCSFFLFRNEISIWISHFCCILFITTRQQNCGKVIFSLMSVCQSVSLSTMSEICTTLGNFLANVQCNFAEFYIVWKLNCSNSAGVISTLILGLNDINRPTWNTSKIYTFRFDNFHIFLFISKSAMRHMHISNQSMR